jgi:hypothetical protein
LLFFVFLIAFELNRCHIDLLGPVAGSISFTCNQASSNLRGSAGHRTCGYLGRRRTLHCIVGSLIIIGL